MNEWVGKFATLERQIADKRGPFALFALFLREDVSDRWDLVVSAPWLQPGDKSGLDLLVTELKSNLGNESLLELSRIVTPATSEPAVTAINQAINVEHGMVEVKDSNFFGLPIKHAFIITSKRTDSPVPAVQA